MDVSALTPSSATTASSSRDTGAARAVATTSQSSADASPQIGGPPFTSPVVGFDSGTGSAILEFRDPTSGQDLFQVPSRMALQYAEAVATTPAPKTDSTESTETASAPAPVVA